MRARLFTICVATILTLPVCSRAELYQFTLEATVEFSYTPNVHVGDRAIIRYIADSFDHSPHPSAGSYDATTATVDFPACSFRSGDEGNVTIALWEPRSFIDYSSYVLPSQDRLSVLVLFRFPSGVLPSDKLPLTLPLDQAAVRVFRLQAGLTDTIGGTVYSYASVAVPEPPAIGLEGLLGCLLVRNRKR